MQPVSLRPVFWQFVILGTKKYEKHVALEDEIHFPRIHCTNRATGYLIDRQSSYCSVYR